MNTSKNRKVIAAVLGLAVTALAVDKIVLGGGATPTLAADSTAAPDLAANGSPAATKDGGAAAPKFRSVTTQLAAIQPRLDKFNGPQLDDAFAPPRALAEVQAAQDAKQLLQERQSKAAEQAEKLRKEIRLTAMVTTNKSGAMINGTFIALGEELSGTGFRLKEVDRKGVLLEDTVTHATVRIELNPEASASGYRANKPD